MADDGTGKEDGYKDLHERWVRGLPLAELDTQGTALAPEPHSLTLIQLVAVREDDGVLMS